MRKTILILTCLFIGFIIWHGSDNRILAQGNNLYFNQALLVSALSTVPAGKVWKVESVLASPSAANWEMLNDNEDYADTRILVNGTSILIAAIQSELNSGAALTSGIVTSLPIWLPEGTTLNVSSFVTYISVIEFNVAP